MSEEFDLNALVRSVMQSSKEPKQSKSLPKSRKYRQPRRDEHGTFEVRPQMNSIRDRAVVGEEEMIVEAREGKVRVVTTKKVTVTLTSLSTPSKRQVKRKGGALKQPQKVFRGLPGSSRNSYLDFVKQVTSRETGCRVRSADAEPLPKHAPKPTCNKYT